MSDGGMYTAMSGGMATSRQLDVTSNNLANINTTGYKKDKTIFKEQLADIDFEKTTEIQAEGVEMPPRVLSIDKRNVLIDENFTQFNQGMLEKTGNMLDIAINGDGFFKVKTPDGIRYTRDGTFNRSKDGLLVTSEGYTVLDENESEIDLGNSKNININSDGSIYLDKEKNTKLSIVSFKDLSQLEKIGKNLFEQKNTQEQEIESKSEIHQGFLESSNVSPVEEMVTLISLHRQFELNTKAIESFSEMDKKASTDLGRNG